MLPARPLVIGAGNLFAGDDAAGRLVAHLLADKAVGFDVAETTGNAAELIKLLEGVARIIIVDACRSGAAPGTLHRFDAAEGPLPAYMSTVSSHGLGVAAAIELARVLGYLPADCIVYAIEGSCFEPGAEISPSVRDAAAGLATSISEQLEPTI
ncbi:MAG: hydrogenase maturation protease [Hyphomicrobiaceae bacterium]|nr:hydrogenase maturation protease [Hyphomicrobiaceae bacterium]